MDIFEVEVNEDEYIAIKEHETERSDELDILMFGLEPFFEPIVTVLDEK